MGKEDVIYQKKEPEDACLWLKIPKKGTSYITY